MEPICKICHIVNKVPTGCLGQLTQMLIKQVHEYYRNKVKIQEQLVLWCISMLYKLLDLFKHSKMCSTFLLSIWMNSIAHWTCLYHRKPKNTLFLTKKRQLARRKQLRRNHSILLLYRELLPPYQYTSQSRNSMTD